MKEEALFHLAGWSAYFNAAVFILSMVALMLFFSIGGIWGRINDSLSIIWMLSYLPLAGAFLLINQPVNAPISLAASLLAVAGVTDVVIVADESAAYLKVDSKLLDREALDRVAAPV